MWQTLMGSKCHLHTIVTARDFVKGLCAQKDEFRIVKGVFSNNIFIKALKTALQILVTIDRLIVKYQSDNVKI
jgi:hypothetical protein